MARPKSTKKTVHTAVRLPEELHSRLSEGGRGNLADEIKRRLEASFVWDQVDAKTLQLLGAVAHMAALVRDDIGPDWIKDPFVLEAFGRAITDWMGVTPDIPFGAGEIAKRSRLWLRDGDSAEQAGANLLRLHKLVSSGNNSNDEWSPMPAFDSQALPALRANKKNLAGARSDETSGRVKSKKQSGP